MSVPKLRRVRLKGTTDSSGDAVITSADPIRGLIRAVLLDIDGLDATADTTITTGGEPVAQTILTLTNTKTNAVHYPKVLAVLNDATALTTTANQYTEYAVHGNLIATIAQGGDTKQFTIDVYVEEF